MNGTFRLISASLRPSQQENTLRRKRRRAAALPILLAAYFGLATLIGLNAPAAFAADEEAQSEAAEPLLDGAEPSFKQADPTAAVPMPASDAENTKTGFYIDPERFEITPPGHIEPLSFIGLFAVDAGVGPNDVTDFDGGFDITDARLAVGGRLEHGFGYFIQTNLIQSTPLLDLVLDWTAADPGFRFAAGYFRTPFSGELLIGAPNLDLINRSQIVRALAPGRQVGIQMDQRLVGNSAVLHAGVFNGNGFDTNDDERFLYMLRLDGTLSCDCDEGQSQNATPNTSSEWQYGLNVAYSEDDDARLGLGLRDRFEGKRLLSGADLRWTRDNLFISAEAIYGRIAPSGRGGWRDVYGYQGTVGWAITPMFQALLRYDAFWAGSLTSDRDLAIASLVVTFSKYVSIQSELRVPVRGESPTPGGIVNLTFQF